MAMCVVAPRPPVGLPRSVSADREAVENVSVVARPKTRPAASTTATIAGEAAASGNSEGDVYQNNAAGRRRHQRRTTKRNERVAWVPSAE